MIRHPDRHASQIRFTAIQTNHIVACKFLSHVNTSCPGLHCPHWHSLNNNATPCALATYTHPFSRPVTQKDVHVSPLPARLPHPYLNISSIIVCLSDGSVSYTKDLWHVRATHTVLLHTEVHQPSVWRLLAFLYTAHSISPQIIASKLRW